MEYPKLSIPYPESVFEEYHGCLAFGNVNFGWLSKGIRVKEMEQIAQDAANESSKPITLHRWIRKLKQKTFEPEGE